MGRLDELSEGVASKVANLGIPEIVKEVIEGIDGFDLAEPLRQVIAGVGGLGGLGGLGELLGPDIVKALGDLGGTVKGLLDLGGSSDIVQQVTKTVGALLESNPSEADAKK
jgi:hypothetical protein